MIRDITIGQYYAKESAIHRLDPRTKLVGVLVFIIVLFLINNPWLYLPCLALLLWLYHKAQVPFLYMMRGLKGILLLLIFTFFFRLISTPGDLLWHWKFIEITQEGITKAIGMTARIALMITGASLLSYTSTPKELADGLEKGCSVLEKIRVPVHDMAVIVMIAFRFIPIMIEELNMLMDAQAARGAKFEEGTFFEKIKNVCTLLMPLFLSTVRRASDLAMAMEARGYTGETETSKMYPLVYDKNDRIAYAGMVGFLFIFLILRFVVEIP